MNFELRPLTLAAANAVVLEHHRHNRPVRGHRFSLGAYRGGELCGVVIVGRPVAREVEQSLTAEITRMCAVAGAPDNTCSFLYAAARRVWFSMGGKFVLTYSLQSESGASLRGAGFVLVAQLRARSGLCWTTRPGRAADRVTRAPKFRWESRA